MSDITVGSVSVEVVPSAERFVPRLRQQLVPEGARIGEELGAEIARAMRLRLDEAFRDLPDAHVNVDADTAEARAEIAALDTTASRLGQDGAAGISALQTALLGLGPALVPVAASVAAVTAGFAGAFAAAGIGAVGFAAVAKTTFGQVSRDLKTAKGDIDKLPGSEQAAARALVGLQTAWRGFVTGLQPAVLETATAALSTVRRVLPELSPIVAATAGAFTRLAREAGAALTSPLWRQFFGFLAAQAGPAINAFARSVGNVAAGFAGLMQAFAPVTKQLEAGLVSLTAKFAAFGQTAGLSSGFQAFLSYVQTTGPKILATLGQLGQAFGHVVAAAAPLGSITLDIISGIATLINKIAAFDPNLLTAAIAVGQLTAAFRIARAALFALTETDPLLLALAGLAVAAVELYTHWSTVWAGIKTVAGEAFSWIIKAVKTALVDPLLSYFGTIIHGADKLFGWVPGVGPKLDSAAKAFDHFKAQVDGTLSAAAKNATHWGNATGSNYASGMGQKVAAAKQAADKYHISVDNALRAGAADAYSIGSDLGAGLVAGMQAQMGAVTMQAKVLADQAAKAMRYSLQIHSPSRVTHQIGQFIGEGLAEGIAASTGIVAQAARAAAVVATPAPALDYRRSELAVYDGARSFERPTYSSPEPAPAPAPFPPNMTLRAVINLDGRVVYDNVIGRLVQDSRRGVISSGGMWHSH